MFVKIGIQKFQNNIAKHVTSAFRSPFRSNYIFETMTQGGARKASLPWADFSYPFGEKAKTLAIHQFGILQ